jgi:putative phage-type endonuclease
MSKFDYDRNTGLGASEAAAVLGISPWVTPLQLWERKTGRAPEQEETLAMRVGSLLEPVVLEQFTRATGLEISHQQERVIDPRLPWRWVTKDAQVSAKELVEAKTTSRADGWGEEYTDEIPDPYNAQAHHGMAVTGASVVWIPVLIAAREFRVYKVERDEELIDMLTDAECEFWLHHVRADIPPDPQPAEASRLWKKDNGKQIVATDEIRAALLKMAGFQIDLDWNEEQAEKIKNQVKLYMRDAAELVDSSGKTLCTWKTAKASNKTDWKALAESLKPAPEVVKAFTKQTEGIRRFLVKGA